MDPVLVPHAVTAASLLVGLGLRMAQHRQQAASDPRAKGILAALTATALLAGVGVAVWSGNWTALTLLDPDAVSLVLVDVAVWLIGVGAPLLTPKKEAP